MIIIGGEGEVDLDDIWALDFNTSQWHRLAFQGISFKARRFHTACAIGHKLYIYGGC